MGEHCIYYFQFVPSVYILVILEGPKDEQRDRSEELIEMDIV